MRTLLALLLLSNLCLMGCETVEGRQARSEESNPVAEDINSESLPDDSSFDSEPESLSASPTESEGFLGPDSFAEPMEINGLKGASKTPGVWLNFYYFAGHPLCDSELAKIKGWANERGVTIASATDANYRYAQVRLIDITKQKPTRDLTFDGNKTALYPTLVIVDRDGRELCHNIGYINLHHLNEDFDRFNRTPSKRRMGLAEVTKAEPDDYRVEDPVTYECGPNGCRIVRRK